MEGLPIPTDHEAVKATLRGICRSVGSAEARKTPAPAEQLKAMVSPNTLRGKRDRALILLGFAGAFRRSELVALDVADIEEKELGLLDRTWGHPTSAQTRVRQDHHDRLRSAQPPGTWIFSVLMLEEWAVDAYPVAATQKIERELYRAKEQPSNDGSHREPEPVKPLPWLDCAGAYGAAPGHGFVTVLPSSRYRSMVPLRRIFFCSNSTP
jgi:hypothetical protein